MIDNFYVNLIGFCVIFSVLYSSLGFGWAIAACAFFAMIDSKADKE